MARPRIFFENQDSINVYLTKDQKRKLVTKALAEKKSPSALVREWINTLPAEIIAV